MGAIQHSHISTKHLSDLDSKLLTHYQGLNVSLGNKGHLLTDFYRWDGIEFVVRKNFGFDCLVELTAPESKFIFELPLPSNLEISSFTDNREAHTSEFMITPFGGQSRWLRPDGVVKSAFSLEENYMSKLVGLKGIDVLVDKARSISRRHIPRSTLISMANNQNALRNILSTESESRRDEFDKRMNLILSEIVGLCEISSGFKVDSINIRSRVAAVALEYIRAHYVEKISLGEVSNACNTSVRTLQYAFKERFKVSFSQYLHIYRLFRFRQHLRDSRNVSEAAYRSGLRHMGRSSVDFKSFFGVSPNQLLHS